MLTNMQRAVLGALFLAALPIMGMAQTDEDVSVNVAPPPLPIYDLPPVPGEEYLWTPGYWAWSDDDQDFYWVPGTWVIAPQPAFFWTPGYWGIAGVVFLWHVGYWGPHVGFYGGINYGYGYGGRGFEGGYWRGNRFIRNQTVVNNATVNRASYNGGTGGIQAEPSATESTAALERHLPPTPAQRQQVQAAGANTALRASINHGIPPIAATARPGAFTGAGVVAAKHSGIMNIVHMGEPAERSPPSSAAPPARSAAPRPTAAPPTSPAVARPGSAAPPAAPQVERQAPVQHQAPAPHQAPEQHPAPEPAHPNSEPRPAPHPAEHGP
jgi:hypothetical protein